MLFKAHDMLRKARSNKTGNCKTILERWCKDDQYRKSLSGIGWTEEQIKQYDAIALEDHSYVSPTEERSRIKKSWTFSLSREGIQGPMNQRPDFIEAKHKMQKDFMKNTQRELVKETDRSILRSKSDSDVTNNSRCWMSTITQLILEQDGKFYPATRPTTSSSSTHWEQHDDWKSNKSWDSWRSSSWTEQ